MLPWLHIAQCVTKCYIQCILLAAYLGQMKDAGRPAPVPTPPWDLPLAGELPWGFTRGGRDTQRARIQVANFSLFSLLNKL